MSKLYTTKQIIIIALIIIIIGAIAISISSKKENTITPEDNAIVNNEAEKLFVEKYVTDNISTIATDKAVLGGTWYVVSVIANPVTDTGEVVYEDGHIQSKANFIYIHEKNPQSIAITKWEVTE